MPNVGYATIQIIPSVRGISDELRRQLVGPAGDAGGDAGEAAGGGLKEKLKVGAAAAGAAAGALLIAGINEAMEQANVVSTLQAQLGATSEDASRYGKIAGQLYSQGITEDIAQGAEVIRSIVNAGLVPPDATNKQLKSIASQMTDVATTFGTDMSMQTQAVSALMKNGLAPNAKSALDVITVGMQKLGPNAEDLLETFQEYPVQLKKLGIDSKQALGLFQQGLQGGARDTDIIADALKEFSIRAIDMSDGSRAAYKSLGLDAKAMEKQIGKGGDSATAGLQKVLDKLRGIHDPVKREAAAVGLFGTQAEELGTSLFKLDPGKAAKGFGDVSGAAANLGKVLHSGPSYEIEVFTRSLKQGFVEFIGGQVLPTLSLVAHGFNVLLLPPIRTVAATLAATLIPALGSLWKAGTAVVAWVRDMGTWMIPVAIAVVGFTAAILAQQIATAAVAAVFAIYRGAILAWTAVQRGATIAQAAFNAVMNANPVILVITAIVALGAALYIAYQRSETFRAIVQGAWEGIQAAASYAWNDVLKPAFAGLKTGVLAVGDAFVWLWTSVIKPVFSFIDTAARILLTVITIVVFGPIYLAVKLLGALFSWLWSSAISPALRLIGAGLLAMWSGAKAVFGLFASGLKTLGGWVRWLYNAAVQPVVDLVLVGLRRVWAGAKMWIANFVAGLKVLAGWVRWLYDKAVAPVVNLILAGLRLAWVGTKVVFGYFTAGLKTLGGWFTWLWNRSVGPAMAGVRVVVATTWTGVRTVFNAMKTAVGLVGKAFGAAKDAIALAWGKVKGIARAPIDFVVNTVYNKGIVGVWNKVAGAFGAPKLSTYKFATGGILPGYTPGRDVHLAALSGGEAIMRPEWTRAVGSGYVNTMNAAARAGGVRGVQQSLGLPGFKDGGIFGWISKAGSAVKGVGSDAWDLVKKGASWLKDTLAASARAGVRAVVNPLLNQIPGLGSGFGSMIKRIPESMVNALFGYADKADEKGASTAAVGGKIPAGQHLAVINAALRAAGVPPPGTLAQWQAGLNTLITRESGWNAGAINRWDSNAKAGHPSQGLAQTIPGTWSAYVPSSLRSRGILDPVGNVAAAVRYIVSRYGNISNVQQANANRAPAGYDSGGWLQPGVTAAVNATGRPEAVLTASQWQVMSAAASGGREPITVEIHTRDRALADFIDVRVSRDNERLLSVINAS